MEKYTCKDAKKDVRFIFSKKADESPEQVREAYGRFLGHAVRQGKGRSIIYCSSCLDYYCEAKNRY